MRYANARLASGRLVAAPPPTVTKARRRRPLAAGRVRRRTLPPS